MNQFIKHQINNGQLVLLLGAGTTKNSQDNSNRPLMDATELAKFLAYETGFIYANEKLATVFSAAKRKLGSSIFDILVQRFRHCKPSNELITLATFPWPRIYSLNIDDALDNALRTSNLQKLNIRYRFDRIHDVDLLYRNLDLVKLNGSIDRVEDGFVFSPKEYGEASASPPPWYVELAQDFFRYNFLFIGTKLDESVFYQQIERYRGISKQSEGRSFVLTPSATEIEKESLLELNIEHINGKLNDFTQWLLTEFPNGLDTLTVATNRRPELGVILSSIDIKEKHEYAYIFDNVVLVNRSGAIMSEIEVMGKIRNFYRGFKPEWRDIVDEVPAVIRSTIELYERAQKELKSNGHLLILYGPAGSGKTTLLKQVAFKLADVDKLTVYYLQTQVSNLSEIIIELEKVNINRYCLVIDRIDNIVHDLVNVLSSGILNKGFILACERQNIWETRVKPHVIEYCQEPVLIHEIDGSDARKILTKIEQYGPWTRLSKFLPRDRVRELVDNAKRQLLIGLLESTSGRGFEEIIQRDFESLTNDYDKKFLIIVGLATIHRTHLSEIYVLRALSYLSIHRSILELTNSLSGIILPKGSNLYARHPVYIQHLFESVVDSTMLCECIKALLYAYTVYEAPVIVKVGKNESTIFKSIINHKFLKALLRGKRDLIFSIYEMFEKPFEKDGLYWLQYGLALRDFDMQEEALEKLQTAYIAYPFSHTAHALSLQELIMAFKSDIRPKAYELLSRAKTRLIEIDDYMKSDDTYPIVTLAIGHTQIIRKFEGDEQAQEVARSYANIVELKSRRIKTDLRLKECWTKLTTYVVTGEWHDE